MIKSFLTKGILNDGLVEIKKFFELPFDLEIGHIDNQITIAIDSPIEIEILCLGGGANK